MQSTHGITLMMAVSAQPKHKRKGRLNALVNTVYEDGIVVPSHRTQFKECGSLFKLPMLLLHQYKLCFPQEEMLTSKVISKECYILGSVRTDKENSQLLKWAAKIQGGVVKHLIPLLKLGCYTNISMI